MSNAPVVSITDDLLAELEQLAGKAGAMALDSAQKVEAANGAMIECPVCGGEGYASAENDYCNFDNHAIGVEFYGIGPEFGLAEAYFRAVNPATILALLQHVRAQQTEISIARADDAQAMRWLAEIRAACGATHGMTFLEMVERVRELRADSERMDSGMIVTQECDEFGAEHKCERRGLNLRAMIDDAIVRSSTNR